MTKNKISLYLLEIILVIFFLITLFTTGLFSNKIAVSIFLLIYAIIVKFVIRKSKTISIYRNEVSLYMLAFAIIYIMIYYLIGYYVGYYEATYKLSWWSIFHQIIPLTVIIISTELIRNEFLIDKSKFSKIMTLLFGVLADLVVYTNIYSINSLSKLLEVLGYVLFASISCNLLFNYINSRFGMKPNILYRLITILYLYVIPITPDVYIYFKSFCRILYPLIIYLVLEYYFGKKKKATSINNRRANAFSTGFIVIVMILITMLISCKFTYGIIVIGSGSMTGTIDKGDAIIFKTKIKASDVKNKEVIVFEKNGQKIVHRVINIEVINGEYRFYTKGDNNSQEDVGYITKEQLLGTVKLKVAKIGFPTIWINNMFSNRKGE